jgi:hypothetical protein
LVALLPYSRRVLHGWIAASGKLPWHSLLTGVRQNKDRPIPTVSPLRHRMGRRCQARSAHLQSPLPAADQSGVGVSADAERRGRAPTAGPVEHSRHLRLSRHRHTRHLGDCEAIRDRTAVHETAYPRRRSHLTDHELQELYTPTPDDLTCIERATKSPVASFGGLILLKTFQRLGSFLPFDDMPLHLLRHLATAMGVLRPHDCLRQYEQRGVFCPTPRLCGALHIRGVGQKIPHFGLR